MLHVTVWATSSVSRLHTWRRARVWKLQAFATFLAWQSSRRLESMVTPSDLSFDATGRVLPATSTVVMLVADQSWAGVPRRTWWGVYPGVGGALLLPLLLAMHLSVMCGREKEGKLKGLSLLFNKLGLYAVFLWGRALLIVPASAVVPMLAHTRGPDALKPGSSGLCSCPRY